MRILVLWGALAGVVIGLVFLGVEGFALYRDQSEVIYDGAYAPLRGVEMTRSYSTTLTLDHAGSGWWNGLPVPWWSYPVIGGAAGALASAAAGWRGLRITGRG
ncbi:hypothetical protein ASG56_10505 [Rhodococcus sp. Leaf7]|uniref:hypothetical protein n=1 Tax=unclassified Rhodococcus (in: high G+C Gram-positive bacteria) TaxID=192944 RepID=UPI0006F33B5C|nr:MULTISPECIES: hypothetical protein [unclassified Rhodococcus (in: high G+C Gram-positive bacteria)]KQU03872.1 hypothetical protein ASG56_10505 [Rhodococcus sp. Leaf7]KQU40056.1 hypothetical protein ASG64_10500 [Rhodococcus sp. Leaf247]